MGKFTVSPEAFAAAAQSLGCDVAAIQAVAQVEAGRQGAFLNDIEPVILFEPHVFDRLTGGKFRGRTVPGLVGPPAVLSREKWTPGTYGSFSVQHARLQAAVELNRDAALKSASWGLFQIMGENFKRCGFETIQAFVNAMLRDADSHLAAFAEFVRSDARLLAALVSHDWRTFARIYNGPGYKRNGYDVRIGAAWAALAKVG